MKTVIVLAMHGAPPNDFPREEMTELFNLHNALEHIRGPERARMEERYNALDTRMRSWPRSANNDPFWAGSLALAEALEKACGMRVVMGFNEFCAPSLDEALDQALDQAQEVLVLTPMMTRGGEHAEKDIPAAIRRAQERRPGAAIRYLWPFETQAVADFLSEQIYLK
ncbi:MAG: CbiX/SirB N-terminal domain-containing protein [Anaerolineales bacterium]|nr:CbiX/SirB N-terminal domain-containing protein [Anaerolineales bacterium]